MAFDANREIKIEGSQGEDNLFTLRTKGLAERKRPELEMTGLPEAALRAAGGVINKVAEYTVNQAEVLADQNIGLFLPRHADDEDEDDRPLMLALHTVVAEPPKTGFFARLGGGGKGVLRLVDVVGDRTGAPLTAIATMLVYRAAVRRNGDDDDGAREELDAALEIFAGDPNAGADPTIGDGSEIFNWQNHLAYLARAELTDVPEEAAALFGKALARSDVLAFAELGARLRDLLKADASKLDALAASIVEHNFATKHVYDVPVPSPAHAVLVSPLWEPVEEGKVGRTASLVPAKFRELYYEGPAAEGLKRAGARLAANAVREALADQSKLAALAWSIRSVRAMWKDPHAPVAETIGSVDPAQGLLSSVLVDVARCFRAGATEAQLAARLRGDGEEDDALSALLTAESEWEAEQYVAAMSSGEN